MTNLEKVQEKLINRLEKVSEKKFVDFAAGWIGIDELFNRVVESIEGYDDIEVLEDALKQLK
ncbi:MAG: hypothetical protein AAB721_00965 [Patescibacteria group bacterium]|mgnify:CR=1 FL=1